MAGWVYGFSGAVDAQTAVILVFKRLRRRGHGFKSHPTVVMGGTMGTGTFKPE